MTTRKSKTASAPEHECTRAAEIGFINGRLDAQEVTDKNIESSLKELVQNHNADRAATSAQFTELKCEIARIGTALELSAKSSEQLVSNQTEMLKQMQSISQLTGAVQTSQDMTQKLLEKHLHESDMWKSFIERRVSKLERTKWFWYTLAGIAVAAAGVISYIANAVDVFVKK